MAKILVTTWSLAFGRQRKIVDSNSKFKEWGNGVRVTNADGTDFDICENIEKVYQLITEAEAREKHEIFDIVIQNQEKIIELLESISKTSNSIHTEALNIKSRITK